MEDYVRRKQLVTGWKRQVQCDSRMSRFAFDRKTSRKQRDQKGYWYDLNTSPVCSKTNTSSCDLRFSGRGLGENALRPERGMVFSSSAAGTYSLKMAGRLKRQTPLTHTISRLVKSEAGRMLPNASEPLVCQLVSWNKWIKVIVPIRFNRLNCVTSPGLKLQGFTENTGILVITMLHKLVFWRSLCLLSLRTVSHLRINKSARSFQRFGSWECQRQYMGSSESFN